jgi:glycosyltransferase involved in cell wall biosynthesis
LDQNIFYDGQKVGIAVGSVDEMKCRITELLTSPAEYAAIGNICLNYTQQFHSPEKIAAEYSRVFTSLSG